MQNKYGIIRNKAAIGAWLLLGLILPADPARAECITPPPVIAAFDPFAVAISSNRRPSSPECAEGQVTSQDYDAWLVVSARIQACGQQSDACFAKGLGYWCALSLNQCLERAGVSR